MRLTIFLLALSCFGQEGFNGGITVWAGPSDHSAATHTLPFRVAASDPATCTVGEIIYRSDLTVGSRLRECDTTNHWATISTGGGSSSVTGLYASALDFSTAIPPGVCTALTYTATGLAAGSALAVGTPSGLAAGLRPRYVASATNTVQVQLCNDLDTDQTPGSLAFSVRDATSLGYISGSATISWTTLVPGQCSTNTITVAGAAAGDNVMAGWPAALNAGLDGYMRVTAADTVTAQLYNKIDADITPPGSGVYKAAITR